MVEPLLRRGSGRGGAHDRVTVHVMRAALPVPLEIHRVLALRLANLENRLRKVLREHDFIVQDCWLRLLKDLRSFIKNGRVAEHGPDALLHILVQIFLMLSQVKSQPGLLLL